ncbi:ABC transporter permease [Hydrogenibacillus sp. N12]|uniref:ABC transporter permease n=1 Tax=Hydrogenibacillus schlegelii TaxID=1484 RepID=A0A947CV75_HYDSH|nr:ABC transporter permease [Hydrogenibacillus sp. N12]MBT9281345.1 ABC transporter permease [Hydrogenibacillus schlegelii]QZA33858.1 ABC transporter permease [Hydrogenibacillus sp. N12]
MSRDERERLEAYRRKKRRERLWIGTTQVALLLAFLLGWEVLSRAKILDPLLFSRPSLIAETIARLAAEGELGTHIAVTVLETIAGFLAGTAAGVLLAALLWFSPFWARVLDPYLVVLNSMPKVALGPLFIVAFGSGMTAIFMMALAVSVIVTTLVVYGSFQATDPNYLKLARSFGANRRQLFTTVVFPYARPAILSALKVNVGLSWIGVIVGEFLAAKAGLGALIIYGFQLFNFHYVLTAVVLIALLSAVMAAAVDRLVRRFER